MSSAYAARRMLRAHRYGALCTLSKKFSGHPFGSIMPYLVDHDGSVLILISALAEHTKNILADPRVSLITHSQDDPHIQAQGRVTLIGTAQRVEAMAPLKKRYLRYFPEASTYFAMHDFAMFRITPQALRYIGGFGNIHWIKAEDYSVQTPAWTAQEEELITRYNSAHHDDMLRLCRQRQQTSVQQVEMLGMDSDGFDLRADEQVMRFDFAEPVLDAHQAEQAWSAILQNS